MQSPGVEKCREAMKFIESADWKHPNVTTSKAPVPLIDHLKQGVQAQPCS